MGGSSLVQNHLRSQSLRPMRDVTPTILGPVMGTEVVATMLQIVPAPVVDMGVHTTIHPISEDECKAHVHIDQSPLVSGRGKRLRYSSGGEDIGAIGKSTIYINR